MSGATTVTKCGKRKRTEWFHVAPDGTETQCLNLVECSNLKRDEGGIIERRSWREVISPT